MLDLTEIEFIGGKYGKPDVNRDLIHYSFVGIQRDAQSGKLQFWLPVGFQEFDNTDYFLVKRFFFRMYRTFKRYIALHEEDIDRDSRDNKRDGLIEGEGGFSFSTGLETDSVFYTKLNALDSILEGFDDLRIASLLQKQKKSSDLDYSQIHKHLHQAIYLEDHVAYIDEMILAKDIVSADSPPILQLFCYIYTEIKTELEELHDISPLATELSEEFVETYLYQGSGLFEEEHFKETLRTLKDTFEEIDRTTPYKDQDYWHFFDAIEAFLYGENNFDDETGVYWGIRGFSMIWEEMCQNYILNYNLDISERVLFADVRGKLINEKNIRPNPFQLSMVGTGKIRFLRPDLVYIAERDSGKRNNFSFNDVFECQKFPRNFYEISLLLPEFEDLFHHMWTQLTFPRKYIPTGYKHNEKIRAGKFDQVKREIEVWLRDKSVEKLQNPSILVVDYKYMGKASFDEYREGMIDANGYDKIGEDIQKQLIYEWALQQNLPHLQGGERRKLKPLSVDDFLTTSEFWIPYYSEEQDFEKSKMAFEVTSADFNRSKIKVIGINFDIVQQMYILK